MALTVVEIRSRATRLLKFLEGEDLSQMNIVLEEPTPYKRRGPGKLPTNHKKPAPPIEYNLVELKVDLANSLKEEDWATLIPTYFKLSRLFPW